MSNAIVLKLNSRDRFSFNEMLAALGIQKNEKGGIGAQKQTQFEYVKQRIFEQTGEIWEWEGTPKDGYWVRGNDTNIAAPSIEKSLPTEALSDAIAATDIDKSKGMKINEAYKLASARGYTTTSQDPPKAFREACKKNPDYCKKFGLTFIEFESGVNKYLFFDTQTQS